MSSVVDGIAVRSSGPVFVHGYDPPAGGKWEDDAIPGKLGALERTSGEVLWLSPCEVGYGRGFGAGFGVEGELVVLGPGTHGHRIVRMSAGNGELIESRNIDAFDEALVFDDLCLCVTPQRVQAISTRALEPAWSYAREGERYHLIARDGDRLYVVYTGGAAAKQGVLILDVETGEFTADLLDPTQSVIHTIAAGDGAVTLLVSEILDALPAEALLSAQSDRPVELGEGDMALLVLPSDSIAGGAPLWFECMPEETATDFPDIVLTQDCGKLYLVQGALLDVRDLVSGNPLGTSTVPGLDEHVAWTVSHGAGVLAEETRLSVFEIPD